MRRKVLFLPSYDSSNGWYNILPPAPAAGELMGDRRADWVVVGAGFTGLSAARRLAEHFPGQSIALVEAALVGQGASGRNAGFAIDHPFTMEAQGDIERARRIFELHKAGVAELARLVAAYRIDCDWSARGKYQVAVGARARGMLRQTEDLLRQLETPFEVLDRDALSRRLGTEFYSEAIYTPGTCLMNPAALARGLAASLPANVALYENSSVVAHDFADVVHLETSKGSMRAPKAILAVDGFSEAFGVLRRQIVNLMTFASLTRPMSADQQARLGGTRDWGVHPVGGFGATIRRTQDERIWLRTSYAYSPHITTTAAQLAHFRRFHIKSFKARFPALGEPDFEHTYGGGLCMTRNTEPFFDKAADNVFVAACQNGIGIAKGTIHGRLIADWAAGERSALLDHARAYGSPAKCPAEPFFGWGVKARLALEAWRGAAE